MVLTVFVNKFNGHQTVEWSTEEDGQGINWAISALQSFASNAPDLIFFFLNIASLDRNSTDISRILHEVQVVQPQGFLI